VGNVNNGTTNSGTRPHGFGLAPFADGYEVAGLGARLLGVPFPNQAFFREENLEGVNWVVCLDSEDAGRRYDPSPLRFLFCGKLDSPLTGNREAVVAVARVARFVDEQLLQGRGVLVHCALGIERTGALVGTVLALNGAAPEEIGERIASLIDELQPGWTGPRFAVELTAAIKLCSDAVKETSR
jgi:Tyrosine phosphatase family